MKAVEYINELIKERDALKELCKKHVDTIRTKEKELIKLNNEISKKDKLIKNFESGSKTNIVNTQNNHELEILKEDFNTLKMKYENLQSEYDTAVNEKNELNRVVNENKKVKDDFEKLTKEHENLQSKYDTVVSENLELKSIFEYIENICDSDEQ